MDTVISEPVFLPRCGVICVLSLQPLNIAFTIPSLYLRHSLWGDGVLPFRLSFTFNSSSVFQVRSSEQLQRSFRTALEPLGDAV